MHVSKIEFHIYKYQKAYLQGTFSVPSSKKLQEIVWSRGLVIMKILQRYISSINIEKVKATKSPKENIKQGKKLTSVSNTKETKMQHECIYWPFVRFVVNDPGPTEEEMKS